MAEASGQGANKTDSAKISIVLGSYPHTEALKTGTLRSHRLTLDFVEMKPTFSAFKPMVRELRYDACEMAIVTFLQAKAAGKPLILLPTPMLSRFQHGYALYNATRGTLTPKDLHGKRVGVRAFTQTTGAWLRGILEQDYGVDWRKVTWVTFEDAHVAEYRDPPNVVRAPEGKTLSGMLLAGEIDASMGETSDDPQLKPLIPEPKEAATAWFRKYAVVPVNHFVVVQEQLARAKPWLLAELYRLLKEAKAGAAPTQTGGLDMFPFGVEANRKTLETIVRFSHRQTLIPRAYTIDELFDERVREFAP
jgi:4,5-dihydroxyphthalate decarboxylase